MTLLLDTGKNLLRLLGFLFLLGLLVPGCQIGMSRVKRQWPEASTGLKVEVIQQTDGRYQLLRDGKPYFIKGIGGRAFLEVAAASGANTIRTWSTAGLDTLLDRADALGMTVMAGLNVVPGRLGLDYTDDGMVSEQLERLKQDVEQFKDHPALLMWIIGNEPDMMYDEPMLWQALDEIGAMVKELDPNHPTTLAMQGRQISVNKLAPYCPHIDLLSVNVFSRLPGLPALLSNNKWGWDGPYIITEWANRGYWERVITDWDAPIEQSSAEKAEFFLEAYQKGVLSDRERCLGSCVFYWGYKQERSQTWFSMFSGQGEKTSRVDAVTYLWSGQWPANRAPNVHQMHINGESFPEGAYVKAGDTLSVEVMAQDPEQDSLQFVWEVRPEGDYRESFGGDAEAIPAPLPGCQIGPSAQKIQVKAPVIPGAYRVFVYVRDGHGSLGAANVPFYVVRKAPF